MKFNMLLKSFTIFPLLLNNGNFSMDPMKSPLEKLVQIINTSNIKFRDISKSEIKDYTYKIIKILSAFADSKEKFMIQAYKIPDSYMVKIPVEYDWQILFNIVNKKNNFNINDFIEIDIFTDKNNKKNFSNDSYIALKLKENKTNYHIDVSYNNYFISSIARGYFKSGIKKVDYMQYTSDDKIIFNNNEWFSLVVKIINILKNHLKNEKNSSIEKIINAKVNTKEFDDILDKYIDNLLKNNQYKISSCQLSMGLDKITMINFHDDKSRATIMVFINQNNLISIAIKTPKDEKSNNYIYYLFPDINK